MNSSLYSVLGGVKKRRKTAFSKVLGVRSVSYNDAAHTVTVNLVKPFKGVAQATIHGGLAAANGGSTPGDITFLVK